MKKWLNVVFGGLTSLLTFVIFSLPSLVLKATGVETIRFSFWTLIENDVDIKGYVFFKVFAIIALILSILMILNTIFIVLQNLGVLKFRYDIVGKILISVLAVCLLMMLIALFILSNKLVAESGASYKILPGFGIWFGLIVDIGICACCSWIFAKNK